MRNISGCLIALAVSAILAGCGGGGASSGGGNNYTPQGPTIANTSLSYYVPFAQGNTWTYSSGAKMQDLGSLSVNGEQLERIALYAPGSNTISSSFFFTKTPPSGQFGLLTNIAGVENDAYTSNITLISDPTFPNGIPVMDDHPWVNESWSSLGAPSTITSIGGTMMLANGEQVIDIAVDQFGSTTPITWSFAKGVGFTEIGENGQHTSITSFSVNTSTSQSAARNPDSVIGRVAATRSASQIDMAPLLGKLFR